MTRPELEELEGQLDILAGAPTERVATMKPVEEAEADPPAASSAPPSGEGSDAESTGPAPSDATADPISAPSPVVPTPDDDVIEDAELVEEPTPVSDDSGPAPAVEPQGTADEPVAQGEPGPSAPSEDVGADVAPTTAPAPAPPLTDEAMSTGGERSRLAVLLKTQYGDTKGEEARHALADICSNGRTQTTQELTQREIFAAIKAAKLLASGHLAFGIVVDDGATHVLAPDETPPDPANATLLAAAPEGESDEQGTAFIETLAALVGGTVTH
jgi:hypothetical protein